jgi:hypothetical protein
MVTLPPPDQMLRQTAHARLEGAQAWPNYWLASFRRQAPSDRQPSRFTTLLHAGAGVAVRFGGRLDPYSEGLYLAFVRGGNAYKWGWGDGEARHPGTKFG